MRHRLLSLIACAVLAAISTGSSVPVPRGGANGNPDMSGLWVGTKKFVDNDLAGTTASNLKGKCEMTLLLVQTSGVLSGTMTLECPGFDPETFTISDGRVGNNHFWFESGTPVASNQGGNYLLAEGEVKSNQSLKGTGIILYGPDYTTRMTFSAKRPTKR